MYSPVAQLGHAQVPCFNSPHQISWYSRCHHHCRRISFYLHLHQHLLLFVFLLMACLTRLRGNSKAIVICISLVVYDAEPAFKYFVIIYVSFLQNCLQFSIPFIECMTCWCLFSATLHVSDVDLYNLWSANIFPFFKLYLYSSSCFLLKVFQFHLTLSVLGIISYLSGVLFRKSLPIFVT